jgi:hypothetical protein
MWQREGSGGPRLGVVGHEETRFAARGLVRWREGRWWRSRKGQAGEEGRAVD